LHKTTLYITCNILYTTGKSAVANWTLGIIGVSRGAALHLFCQSYFIPLRPLTSFLLQSCTPYVSITASCSLSLSHQCHTWQTPLRLRRMSVETRASDTGWRNSSTQVQTYNYKYEYEYEYTNCEYDYTSTSTYPKFVLELYSSASRSTEYYISAA